MKLQQNRVMKNDSRRQLDAEELAAAVCAGGKSRTRSRDASRSFKRCINLDFLFCNLFDGLFSI